MRKTITVSLPKDLQKQLDVVVRKEGRTRSEIVRESLRNYLWECEFERLRREMVPHAQAMGIFTDEDVFKRFA